MTPSADHDRPTPDDVWRRPPRPVTPEQAAELRRRAAGSATGPPPALLRPTTRDERNVHVAVALAMVAAFAVLALDLGQEHLLLTLVAVAVIVACGVLGVAAEWRRRVEPPHDPAFWGLPAARRRALRRALFSGELGEPADRPYARFWLGRRLRYPANCVMPIGMAAFSLSTTAAGYPGWPVSLSWGVAALGWCVPLMLRPRWLHLAERADAELAAATDAGT